MNQVNELVLTIVAVHAVSSLFALLLNAKHARQGEDILRLWQKQDARMEAKDAEAAMPQVVTITTDIEIRADMVSK